MKLEALDKDGTYHIYNRGINGETIFRNDENKNYFLRLLGKHLTGKSSLHAYCLMNNHFHFLLTVDVEEDVITQSLSNLFNAYAKAFNKANSRTGSLFEKHFRRIHVNDEDYVRQLIVYIHLNPKHHFNLDFENYKHSSYRAFLSDKETKLSRNESLKLFGDKDNFIFVHKQRNDLLEDKYKLE